MGKIKGFSFKTRLGLFLGMVIYLLLSFHLFGELTITTEAGTKIDHFHINTSPIIIISGFTEDLDVKDLKILFLTLSANELKKIALYDNIKIDTANKKKLTIQIEIPDSPDLIGTRVIRFCKTNGTIINTKKILIEPQDSITQTKKNYIYNIMLDYKTGAISPYGAVEMDDGKILRVTIEGITKDSFEIAINGQRSESKPQENEKNLENVIPEKKFNEFDIVHRSENSGYQVVVTVNSVSRTWVIPVFTTHWTVDFSGAFIGDTLGKPSYYLEPGVRVNPTTKANENGFYVRKNEESSKIGLGTAAMVHLYYNKNRNKCTIIPVTFGIGVSSGSVIRYFIGPSLRFGGAAYLTLGAVVGEVDVPPATAPLDAFVTDANALTNMAKKTKPGIFVGFSYSFTGGNSQQRLQQPFALPSTAETTESEEREADSMVPNIESVTYEQPDDNIVVKGTGFGIDKDLITLHIEGKDTDGKKLTDDLTGAKLDTVEKEQDGKYKITFTKTDKLDTKEFKVTVKVTTALNPQEVISNTKVYTKPR